MTNNNWEVVIGLETHTQLKTNSKIFSGASIQYGAAPNTQADEVSTALPGVLPVLNRQAVECAIKFGLAINAEIPARSVFSRKNYFYPDLPKGYQISQFELPVVSKGAVIIQVPATKTSEAYEKVINITRAHLEEDAGKSSHGVVDGMSGIDLNRAGTPLLEIVTEPDMRSAAEAVAYAKKLHELVQWIDICDGNMQEGSFRCDVNVSVRPKGQKKFGTRREIKNLNSFKFMTQAIEYETQWQIETLEDGGIIHQATVLFNPDANNGRGETKAMRSKEEANDYRYFPDPDLLPLEVTAADKARVHATMPELPDAMKARFEADFGLSTNDAASLTASRDVAEYFVTVLDVFFAPENFVVGQSPAGENIKLLAKSLTNWMMGTFSAKLNAEELTFVNAPVSASQFAQLLLRIADCSISNNAAKQVFEALWLGENNGDVDAIIAAKCLKQESDSGAIETIIDEVLIANAAMVEEFKAGKEKAFNALVGQAMKASKGKANPAQVTEILKKKLTS